MVTECGRAFDEAPYDEVENSKESEYCEYGDNSLIELVEGAVAEDPDGGTEHTREKVGGFKEEDKEGPENESVGQPRDGAARNNGSLE